MDNLDTILTRSLDRYFTLLSKTGYLKQEDVDCLIVLLGIKDSIQMFDGYITDNDVEAIYKALKCIGKSCIITMPVKYTLDSLFHDTTAMYDVRSTQYDSLRSLEDNSIRNL